MLVWLTARLLLFLRRLSPPPHLYSDPAGSSETNAPDDPDEELYSDPPDKNEDLGALTSPDPESLFVPQGPQPHRYGLRDSGMRAGGRIGGSWRDWGRLGGIGAPQLSRGSEKGEGTRS